MNKKKKLFYIFRESMETDIAGGSGQEGDDLYEDRTEAEREARRLNQKNTAYRYTVREHDEDDD